MAQLRDTLLPLTLVLNKITLPVLLMLLMLFMSWTGPVVKLLQVPYDQLRTPFTESALWLSNSGHFPEVIVIAVVALLIIISTCRCSNRLRAYITLYSVLISLLFAGGGAWLNENVVKEKLKHPRPNIEYLGGESGNGPLGMTVKEFYQGSTSVPRTKSQRSKIMQQVLNQQPPPVSLSDGVREHWIKETGYSFPSGHAFAAMFFASFFLALGISCLSGWKKYAIYLLLPWAVAVCYSRLVLKVHTPLDITIGGLEGLVLGLGGFLLIRLILQR